MDRPAGQKSAGLEVNYFYPPLQCCIGRTKPHYWKIHRCTHTGSLCLNKLQRPTEGDKTFALPSELQRRKAVLACSEPLLLVSWQPSTSSSKTDPEPRRKASDTCAPLYKARQQLHRSGQRTWIWLREQVHSQNALLPNHQQQLLWFYLNFSCALRHQNYSWPSPKLDSNLMWKYHWRRDPCAKD